MENNLKYEKEIFVKDTIDKVWDTLTKSEYTKQYMFNCEVSSDWKIGSDITWKGDFMGYDAFQKGTILEYTPKTLIKYSTFDPNSGYEDNPEKYVHVTYRLTQKADGVELVFVSDNFGEDKKRCEDTANGWDNIVIPAFQKLFE